MIRIDPFAPADLAAFVPRPEQRTAADPPRARALAAAELGPAFTARDDDGHVLGCAGLCENSREHATAWALFADQIRPAQWARITAAIREVLSVSDYRRIDMMVRSDFAAARHFAEALGFEEEAVLYARHAEPLFQRDENVSRGTFHEEVAR